MDRFVSPRPLRSEVRRIDQVPKLLEEKEECTVCSVCRRHKAIYVCPSCYQPYCCATCYSTHNANCSERFYKKQVKDELKVRDMCGEKQGLFCRDTKWSGDLLREDNSERLQALLKGACPTPQEERLALEAAHRGDFALDLWKPWWLEETNVIEEEKIQTSSERPRLFRERPTYHSLLRRVQVDVGPLEEPSRISPFLRFSVLDVLIAYVRMARYFDGEYIEDTQSAASYFVQCSPVLSRDARHESVNETLYTANEHARAVLPALSQASIFEYAAVAEDAARLIETRGFAAAALLDAWRIAVLGQAPKAKVHKLRFLLRWIQHHAPENAFPSTAACCRTVIQKDILLFPSTCSPGSSSIAVSRQETSDGARHRVVL